MPATATQTCQLYGGPCDGGTFRLVAPPGLFVLAPLINVWVAGSIHTYQLLAADVECAKYGYAGKVEESEK